MKEELKQAISQYAEQRASIYHDKGSERASSIMKCTEHNNRQHNFEQGAAYALTNSEWLRHCDPEIMKQAGWFNKTELQVKIDGNYFPVHCECGWIGGSEELLGGGAIADTGDYFDCYCPSCGTTDISEADELTVDDYKNAIQSMTKIIIGLRDEVEKNHWEKRAGWVREDNLKQIKHHILNLVEYDKKGHLGCNAIEWSLSELHRLINELLPQPPKQ